jgi:hypothetical protein
VHQAYITDIEASVKEALARVDPLPFYMAYGENFWAGVKAHLDTVTDRAAAPIIAKYTGVLAAADIEVFTRTTTSPSCGHTASTTDPADQFTRDDALTIKTAGCTASDGGGSNSPSPTRLPS